MTPKARHKRGLCQNCSHAGHCAAMGCQGWPLTDVPKAPRIPALGKAKGWSETASITILWFLSQNHSVGHAPPTPPHSPPTLLEYRATGWKQAGHPMWELYHFTAPQKLSGCFDFLEEYFVCPFLELTSRSDIYGEQGRRRKFSLPSPLPTSLPLDSKLRPISRLAAPQQQLGDAGARMSSGLEKQVFKKKPRDISVGSRPLSTAGTCRKDGRPISPVSMKNEPEAPLSPFQPPAVTSHPPPAPTRLQTLEALLTL